MSEKVLSQFRVIDLTHYMAGPYCTKLMAGFGAEVIKIERPHTGDGMRQMGPFFKDSKGPETSIPFLWLNTGKKSITLDLKAERGKEIFKGLVRDADVLVENFSPGVMKRLGMDFDTLCKFNPSLIMTSISNFGQSGPYRDFRAEEAEIHALSGGMFMAGSPDKPPLAAGPALCQYTAGQHAYVATLMAIFQRMRGGKGQFIDVSIHESALEHIEITLSYNLQTGAVKKRGEHLFVPWDAYECKDGYCVVIGMPARHWHRASEVFEDARLFDKKYDLLPDRIAHRAEYENILKPCVQLLEKEKLFIEGQARGLAFGYLADLAEAGKSPQHEARSFFSGVDHPVVGQHPYCDAPFRMSETPWTQERAPLLGEHNRRVYEGLLGFAQQEVRQLAEGGVI